MAGELAVGVVAHERAVGDRAVEPLLGRAHARVEPLGDLLDAACSAAKAACSEAAWATRSSRPVARARRAARRAGGACGPRARPPARARPAPRAPAASAAMPGGSGQLIHGAGVYERAPRPGGAISPPRRSPGTRTGCCRSSSRRAPARPSRVIVTAAPSGGASRARGRRSRSLSAAIWSIVSAQRDRLAAAALDRDRDLDVELVVLAPVGELDREGGVRRVGELVGRVRAAASCRRRSTESMPVPCRPGPVGSSLLRPAPAESCWPSCCGHDVRLQPLERGQEGRLRDLLAADLAVVERRLDRTVARASRRRRRRPGRPASGRRSAGSPRRRRRPSRRARCGSAGRCSRGRRGATRARSAATAGRRASRRERRALGLLELCSACTRKPEIAVCRSCGDSLPPWPRSRKNSAPTCVLGLVGDRRDLAVVVLERVLLGRARGSC